MHVALRVWEGAVDTGACGVGLHLGLVAIACVRLSNCRDWDAAWVHRGVRGNALPTECKRLDCCSCCW